MSTPDRGPLLLVLAGLVAFLAFYVLGRESSPVPPPSTPSIARTTEGAASAPPLDAANGRAITAKKGDRPEEKPPGSTPGSEAVAEASRKARAEAEGEVVAGGADGAYVDETGEGSGLDALFRHTLGGSPASPAGAGAPANAAEGGAVGPEEDAAPLPECEKPIISKSVFHLEFQPEMRSAFDAALQLARTGGRFGTTLNTGGGEGYLLFSSDKGNMEAGAIFDNNLLVIVRGKCLSDPSQLTAALVP